MMLVDPITRLGRGTLFLLKTLAGIPDPEERRAIIAFLANLSD